MIEELDRIGSGYKITDPIMVKVAASMEGNGKLYCLTVVNLNNELIFGMGTTKRSAYEMLRTELKKYYDFLMSSDLDRFSDSGYFADKKKLSRSIQRESST